MREFNFQNNFNLRFDCFDSDDDSTAIFLSNFLDKDFENEEDKNNNHYMEKGKNLKKEDLIYDLAMDKRISKKKK